MVVCYGVVRGNRIDLEGDVRLADGQRVEVRLARDAAATGQGSTTDTAAAEEALLQDLLAAGLLEELPGDEAAPDEPFGPVTVRGRPLSEQVIAERR